MVTLFVFNDGGVIEAQQLFHFHRIVFQASEQMKQILKQSFSLHGPIE